MVMAPSDNAALLHGWAEGLSAGDLDRAISYLADDFVGHYSAMPQPVQGPAAVKGMIESFIRPAFPDQKITIERTVTSGDRIGFQMLWTATHQGPFLMVPATGKQISCAGTGIFRIEDGKIAEAWVLEDFLGIYQQITGG